MTRFALKFMDQFRARANFALALDSQINECIGTDAPVGKFPLCRNSLRTAVANSSSSATGKCSPPRSCGQRAVNIEDNASRTIAKTLSRPLASGRDARAAMSPPAFSGGQTVQCVSFGDPPAEPSAMRCQCDSVENPPNKLRLRFAHRRSSARKIRRRLPDLGSPPRLQSRLATSKLVTRDLQAMPSA